MKSFNSFKSNVILIASCTVFATAVFSWAHEWMAPKEAAKIQNPVAAGAESVARGKELFLDNCAYCHGDGARGMTAEEAGLKSNPPDLVKRLSNHSDGDFFWKIQRGKREMPSFAEDLTEEEIWHIINFIKSEPVKE